MTPAEYVKSLAPERQKVVKKLRQVLKKNLPKGFRETMGYGMLAYVVPHSLYPDGYHSASDKPLPFINIASQKQYVSLYHMGLYDEKLLGWLRREWPLHTEMKLDVGKCCVRMKRLEQIPYALIGELAGKMTPKQWIEKYETSRESSGSRKALR
jgi:hypothetical protein